MNRIKKSSLLSVIIVYNRKNMVPALLLTYLLMIIIFTSFNKLFLSPANIGVILINLAIPGIVAVGSSFVFISRNIDFSVGSIMCVTSIIVAKLFNIENLSLPIPVIIFIGLAVGIGIGFINGLLITSLGINSIVVTLGTLVFFRGIAYIYSTQTLLIKYKPFTVIGRGYIFKYIPLTFLYFLGVFIILYLVIRFSKFGRYVYAIGGNAFIAKLYGVNVKRIQLVTFIISGFTASISGILMVSQLSFAAGDFALGYEFIIITIVVLGGVSVRGGRGSMIGVLIAIFIYGSILNGLTVIGIPILWRESFLGLILIFAIIADSLKYRNGINNRN